MQAEKLENGTYNVLGDSGHTYKVTDKSCNCPHFVNRLRGKGSCKHMVFVNNLAAEDNDIKEILNFINSLTEVTFDTLHNKFGDNTYEALLMLEKRGDIIYNRKSDTYSVLK